MSATNKTPNLDLPQWVQGDDIERADFNEAFSEIDGLYGERGSNANGSWYRLPSGLQVCEGSFEISKVSNAWGSVFMIDVADRPTITFPKAFIAPPDVNGWVGTMAAFCVFLPYAVTKTDFIANALRGTTGGVNVYPVSYTAIGYWK